MTETEMILSEQIDDLNYIVKQIQRICNNDELDYYEKGEQICLFMSDL